MAVVVVLLRIPQAGLHVALKHGTETRGLTTVNGRAQDTVCCLDTSGRTQSIHCGYLVQFYIPYALPRNSHCQTMNDIPGPDITRLLRTLRVGCGHRHFGPDFSLSGDSNSQSGSFQLFACRSLLICPQLSLTTQSRTRWQSPADRVAITSITSL
jgi:hypothetical protein